MRLTLSALACVATLAAANGALAQGQWSGSYSPAMPTRSSSIDNLGEEMQFVFGVDGVMGVDIVRDKDELSVGGQTSERTDKATSINLFGGGIMPRLALDYFVTEGFSVGGSFVFLSQSSETETSAGGVNQTTDNGSLQTLFIHPRVGYALPFDETFSFWPRVGLFYMNQTTKPDQGSDTSRSAIDFTLEAMFGISPMSHFAILVGPYLYLGVGGSSEIPAIPPATGTTETDRRLTMYGLTTSIVGYY
ncbi:MAG: hypothetical protein KF718_32320 [Polyangiaceae bacterium]|nr:hypothetical protein [Polyangiaceae bacterium]